MQGYSTNLPHKSTTLKNLARLAVPLLFLAYPVAMIFLPEVLRAMIPQVVRSVLSLL